MELKDTIEMMQSDDYKERFKAEYYQLKIRRDKLQITVNKIRNDSCNFEPKTPLSLLVHQLDLMNSYKYALEARAEFEGIDL